jgi:hypothetical protein
MTPPGAGAMEELARNLLDWLSAHPLALVALVLLAFVAVMVLPLLLVALVLQAAGRTVSGGLRAGPWARAITLLVLTAVLLGGVHWWSTHTAEPLLIYGEGPVPRAIHRVAYDFTLEPDGSLLVTEEIAMTLGRDLRALFRPLRRDEPAEVLSLTDNGRPIPARAWIGPQAGIRMGTGTPRGEHVYRLTYRLAGATRDGQKDPERVCVPFGGCTYLTDQREPIPVQRVRWHPITWPVSGEQVFTWHFPRPYRLDQLAPLNGRYTWAESGATQPDERTLAVRRDFTGFTKPPDWVATLAVPAGMTEARTVRGSFTPSLPVFAVPLLALLGVIVARLRLGGTPTGLATLKAEYTPPDGLSAAVLGRLVGAPREALVAAALADAAQRGVVRVDHLQRALPMRPDQHDDEFTRTGEPATLGPPEASFIRSLLRGRDTIRLSQLEGYAWEEAGALESDLHRALVAGGYINRRRELQRIAGVALAVALAVGGPYATFYLGNRFPWLLPMRGAGPAAVLGVTEPVLAAWALAALIVLFYAFSIPTITRKGALARSRALGFAEYLRTAELGPIEHEAQEGRAVPYLAYALALGLSADLAERWRGLTAAPDDEDERRRRRGTGEARFGDAGVLRRQLLAAPVIVAPRTVDGGRVG